MGLFLLNFAGPLNSVTTQGTITESKLLCQGPKNQSFVCESGYCCESQCCSHYYELWWFWLVWTIIIILICCCVCHHRRTKHRLQQQQRQHEINLIAYREAHNYTSLPFYLRFLPSYLLPAYEEVVNRPPTPPPPYSPAQTAVTEAGGSPTQTDQPESHCPQGPANHSGPGAPSAPSAPSPEQQQQQLHLPVSSLSGPRGVVDDGKALPGAPLSEGRQQHPSPQVSLLAGEAPPARGSKARDCCKEPGGEPLGCPSPLDDKDRTPGRHRRFTGDSGIEVCVCSRGVGEDEEEEEDEDDDDEEHMKELERLMDAGEEEEVLHSRDFCDSCHPPGGVVHHQDPMGPADEERGHPDGLEQVHHHHPPHHHHHHHPHQQPSEQGLGQASLPRSPVCLHLHTINEQDGSHSQGSAESQS